MTTSLMQQVLGADWSKLPRVIQRHYEITDQQSSYLEGEMVITYPGFMFPMIWLIHLFGGLILWRGDAVQTRVQKTMQAGVLHWQRIMTYPDGKTDYFRSQMTYLGEHELIESTGFGFGLRLIVEVNNGDLVYRSNGHLWQYGKFVLNIPDWLLLGSATISEHALSEDEFYLDFTIKHPLWGETYGYRGKFRYC
jgi:Domain of unknown function (DUF4166)